MRQLIVLTIVTVGVIAVLWTRPVAPPAVDVPTLSYVTTAHQLGVVGYRDPAGAISPDGKQFAYSEGRFIRVIPIGGGAPVTLALGEGQIRYLTWSSNDSLVAEDATPSARWWTYRVSVGDRQPLWGGSKVPVGDLRQLTWSADGNWTAAISLGKDGAQLWRIGADGVTAESRAIAGRVSFPSWTDDDVIACIVDARLTVPCGEKKLILEPDVDVYGPIAFKGEQAFFASPDGNGSVALWTADMTTLKARRISSFSRDAYGPSVGGNTVVFKTQSYRTFLADAPATGGAARQLATFQSETPSYHPTRPLVAFTYGTWRRIVDDANYPDIAQEIGVIDISKAVPAEKRLDVIAKSDSEDQAMAWSPNGKWIAFHSHREMSDDVWLRPSGLSTVASAKVDGQPDKRITFLGRGAEVGWPRWSPDGRTVLLDGVRKGDGQSVIYAIGVDQATGAVTSDLREVRAEGFSGDITHAEWLGNGNVIGVAKEGPGRHAILTLPIGGGVPRIIHRYATEHDFSGLAVSPGGKFVAFAAPAPDGYYQIFTKGIDDGASALQITSDRSHKTQPAWSPDGARIAFTVWSYDATFWSFNAR